MTISCMPVEGVNIMHVMGQMLIYVTSHTSRAVNCKSPVVPLRTNFLTISYRADRFTAPVFSITAC